MAANSHWKRRTAKQIALESRPRIDKTKALTLDERIAIVDKVMAEHGISPTPEGGKKLAAVLISLGYEPMMFKHACNVVLSRR